MSSLLATDWRFSGGEGGMDRVLIQGSMLPLQRNEAIQRMRGHFLIFIDDDMVWPPDAIEKLVDTFFELDHQFDEPILVGGLCFRRQFPFQPTMYMREKPDEGGYRFLEDWSEEKEPIIEVDATGCAFLLIPVTAIEAITETEMPPYAARREMHGAPEIFRWTGKLGEDLRFCQEFKAKGGRIFVDTRIKVGHIGEMEIGYQHFLEAITERNPIEEERSRTLNKRRGLPTLTKAEAKKRLNHG
jgi:glycosyltransferase involved in cell wall biosynthesis